MTRERIPSLLLGGEALADFPVALLAGGEGR